MIKTNLGVDLKRMQSFLHTCIVFAYGIWFIPSLASADVSIEKRIENELRDMGYVEVSVTGCELSFSRNVSPTRDNNYFKKYDRYVNVSTLDLTKKHEVAKMESGGPDLFFVEIPLNEKYYSHKAAIEEFKLWAIKNYPDSRWPFDVAHDQGEFTPIIEEKLWQEMPQISELNRWTFHARYGASTVLYSTLQLTYDDPAALKSLLDAIYLLSKGNSCSE